MKGKAEALRSYVEQDSSHRRLQRLSLWAIGIWDKGLLWRGEGERNPDSNTYEQSLGGLKLHWETING